MIIMAVSSDVSHGNMQPGAEKNQAVSLQIRKTVDSICLNERNVQDAHPNVVDLRVFFYFHMYI